MEDGLCFRRLLMTESRLQKCIVTVYCVLMMFVLGASDALRGVFLPVFRDSFSLSQSQSSAIIMCSYIGNLLFLCIGVIMAGLLLCGARDWRSPFSGPPSCC